MFNYNDMNAHAATRQQDLMREGQQSRLAAEAGSSDAGQPFYAPALARVGMVLSEIGNDLQHRYGEVCREVVEMPASMSDPSIQIAR